MASNSSQSLVMSIPVAIFASFTRGYRIADAFVRADIVGLFRNDMLSFDTSSLRKASVLSDRSEQLPPPHFSVLPANAWSSATTPRTALDWRSTAADVVHRCRNAGFPPSVWDSVFIHRSHWGTIAAEDESRRSSSSHVDDGCLTNQGPPIPFQPFLPGSVYNVVNSVGSRLPLGQRL